MAKPKIEIRSLMVNVWQKNGTEYQELLEIRFEPSLRQYTIRLSSNGAIFKITKLLLDQIYETLKEEDK